MTRGPAPCANDSARRVPLDDAPRPRGVRAPDGDATR